MSKQDSYRYTIEDVNKLQGSLLNHSNESVKPIIDRALTMIPKETADYIIQKCFLLSTWKEVNGAAFQISYFKGKDYLIVISDDILENCFGRGRDILPEHWNEAEGYRTILHEFAHCWLSHKSSPGLAESERIHQEEDAFGVAEEWFSEYNIHLKTTGQPFILEQVREKYEHQE